MLIICIDTALRYAVYLSYKTKNNKECIQNYNTFDLLLGDSRCLSSQMHGDW